jgi:hypothetical protein
MTHDKNKISELESLSMTAEEKERALENMLAVINSADPPIWAGLPMPERQIWWRKLFSNIKEILF